MNLWFTDNQGKLVKGGSGIQDREGSVEVLKVLHGIHLPYDRDTGMLQSTRKHAPLGVLKMIDQSSPFLAKACCNGMNLKHIRLDVYRIHKSGQEEPFYRYELENAKVVGITPHLLESHDQRSPYVEHVDFIYQKISWTFLNGNYSYTDTWQQRS